MKTLGHLTEYFPHLIIDDVEKRQRSWWKRRRRWKKWTWKQEEKAERKYEEENEDADNVQEEICDLKLIVNSEYYEYLTNANLCNFHVQSMSYNSTIQFETIYLSNYYINYQKRASEFSNKLINLPKALTSTIH